MEQRAIRTGLDIVDCAGLEVNVERAGDILARASLGEERRETTVVVGLRALSRSAVRLLKEMSKPNAMDGKDRVR